MCQQDLSRRGGKTQEENKRRESEEKKSKTKTKETKETKSLSIKKEWLTRRRHGKGQFGNVYQMCARHNPKEFAALKITLPRESYSTFLLGITVDILREIHTLNLVHDRHIIRLLQADVSYNQQREWQHLKRDEEQERKGEASSSGTDTTQRRLSSIPIPGEERVKRNKPINPQEQQQQQSTVTIQECDLANGTCNPYAYLLLEDGDMNMNEWRKQLKIRRGNLSHGKEIIRACFHMFLGLRALHSHGINHNDLKPANIIYFSVTNEFKLADFGISLPPAANKWKQNNAQAPGYRAPEILMNQHKSCYTSSSDIWAAAIVMLQIVFGGNLACFPRSKTKEKLKSVHMFEDILDLLGLIHQNLRCTITRGLRIVLFPFVCCRR